MQGGLPELERRGGCRGREGTFRGGEWPVYNFLFTIGIMTHDKYPAKIETSISILLSVLCWMSIETLTFYPFDA